MKAKEGAPARVKRSGGLEGDGEGEGAGEGKEMAGPEEAPGMEKRGCSGSPCKLQEQEQEQEGAAAAKRSMNVVEAAEQVQVAKEEERAEQEGAGLHAEAAPGRQAELQAAKMPAPAFPSDEARDEPMLNAHDDDDLLILDSE